MWQTIIKLVQRNQPGLQSVRSEHIDNKTFEMVSAGDQLSLRISKQITPWLFMLQWYIRVRKVTWKNAHFNVNNLIFTNLILITLPYLWRFERILGREMYVQEEDSSFINRSRWAQNRGHPFVQVVSLGSSTAVWWRIQRYFSQLLLNSTFAKGKY